MLEIGHGLKRVARKCSEGPAEANHHQQPLSRIEQDPLRGPNDEKTDNEAAHDVDEQSSVRKDWAQFSRGKTTEEIAQIGANDGGDGYGNKILHDGESPYKRIKL